MRPKVSIVVPIYKVPELFLRNCIESLMGQTLKSIEIVLVDDGSPDNCGMICEEYAEKDSRIKVIHKKNGGLAAARNSGVDACTGETFMFVDGDDFLASNCCEKTYNLLKEKKVQMVLFDQQRVYSKTIIANPICGQADEYFLNNNECRELQARVLSFNDYLGTVTSKLVYLDYINRFKIRHDEDIKQGVEGFIYNIRQMEHLESAYYIHEPFYNYVYNNKSITHTPNMENFILIIKGLERIKQYGKTHPVSLTFNKNVMTRVLYGIVTTAIQGCFNPLNRMTFKEKSIWFDNYLNMDMVKNAIANAERSSMDKQRSFILYLAIHKYYRCLAILAMLRRVLLNFK